MAKFERLHPNALGRVHVRNVRPRAAPPAHSIMSPRRPPGVNASPANHRQGPAQVGDMGPSSLLADGILEKTTLAL